MSEARQGRFEIDLEEIERQLRQSAEAAPAPKSDPLAELARIVGQDDPFKKLFGNEPGPARGSGQPAAASSGRIEPVFESVPHPDPVSVPEGAASQAEEALLAEYRAEEEAVLHGDVAGPAGGQEEVFDPVSRAYGSLDDAVRPDDFQPLAPPRSRKGLIAGGVAVALAVVAVGGTLAWRQSGSRFAGTSGAPPIVKADTSPLKVAPENPGGMEIPNQDRQIYERGAQDGQARVVDRQEQPIDVREAARALPPPPKSAGPAPATRPNAVTSALGEPRRVRTVSVRPDGTLLTGPARSTPSEPAAQFPSPASLPAPVPVTTVPITTGSTSIEPAPAPAEAVPSPSPTTPAVTVLPPPRPRSAAASSPQLASASAPSPAEDAASTSAGFTVQLGVRGSEAEATASSSGFSAKYASVLSGYQPAVSRAEVNGKTVFRVRVGPMSRGDADALCKKLKASGGQCFIAKG